MINTILFICAAVCFGLAALKVSTFLDLQNAGFFFLTLALFLL